MLLLSSLLIIQWLILSPRSKTRGNARKSEFGVWVGIVMVGCEGLEVKHDKEQSTADNVKHWLLNSICTDLDYIFGRSVSSPAETLERSVNNRWGIWVVVGVWCFVLSWKELGCMLLITHQHTTYSQIFPKMYQYFCHVIAQCKDYEASP